MTSLQLYQNFLIKVNKNDSNSNISVPKGKFVIIYNEQAKKWLENALRKKVSTNEIDRLNSLLVDNNKLVLDAKHMDHYDFYLPSDFFDISSSFSIAERNDCERVLDNWPVKDKNVRVLLSDSNFNPSFDFEETLCSAVNNKLKVYFNDFEIKEVFLTYYRQPKDIDVEGYIKENNQPSQTIDPDVPDFIANEILDRCALEVQGIIENAEGYSVSKEKVDKQ